jgi:hypothetical protein
MIASPGDVFEARDVARDVIHEWNYVNSMSANAVLMPVGWETHSSPELSGRPQEIINKRLLENCDLLVGIFWTRLGTPTGESASGTVEEIQHHVRAGKPAMVYFSTAPVAPQSLEQDQFNALMEFKAWCQNEGLVETFENIVDFRQKFSRHLQIALNQNEYLRGLLRAARGTTPPGIPVESNASAVEQALSNEAKRLLVEASLDKGGVILRVATLGGRYIQTNAKNMGDPSDRRSMARWEYALEQLLGEGLVVPRGQKGQVFEVTEAGYQLAEALRGSQE